MGKASRKKKISVIGAVGNQASIRGPANTLQRRPSAITLIPTIVILFLSFAVYVNAISGDFVYDDSGQIVNNPWIKDITNINAIFSSSVWSFQARPVISNYYRPLMHILYMLNFHVFGLKPWGFHLVNILLHCGASVLVFLIIKRLLAEQNVSEPSKYLSSPFLAAMLFAVHPIHTEAVTWIAGLPDVAFTFFYLLSFYLYERSEVMLSRSYLFSIVCFTFAAFFKEPALTLPVILVAHDYAFCKGKTIFSDYLKRYIPYLVIGAVYLMCRIHALGAFAPQERYATLSAYQYAINAFPLFIQYLGKLLLPINLNAFYVFHPIASLSAVKGVLSLIATITFIAACVLTPKKDRLVFFGLLLVAVPLLPVLYIPALGENTFTDRYLYLPSVGYVLLLAFFLSWARMKLARAAIGATIVFLMAIGAYSYGTITRNNVWKNNFSLWSDTVRKSPDSEMAHNNLAVEYSSMGELDMAITEYQTVLRLNPDSVQAHINLGNAYTSKGLLDMAISEFRMALKLNPDSAEVYNNLGVTYRSKGQTDMAIEEFLMALNLNPNYAGAHNSLGVAYRDKGQIDVAIEQFLVALRLNPLSPESHNNLGVTYAMKNQLDKATTEFQTALRLKPDDANAHYNLAVTYQKEGRVDGARMEAEAALRISPEHRAARRLLDEIVATRS